MTTETLDRLTGMGTARFPSGAQHRVAYRLRVTRELLTPRPGDAPLPGLLDVDGDVDFPSAALDPSDVGAPFELELSDGRRLSLILGRNGVRLADIGDLRNTYH